MPRPPHENADRWLLALIWAGAGAACAGAAFDWHAGVQVAVSLAAASGATILLRRAVLGPREASEARLADAMRRQTGTPSDSGSAGPIEAAARMLRVQLPEMRTRLANLGAMLEAIADPVLATDSGGVVILCNRAASEFLDSRAGSPVGRSVDEIFTQTDVLTLHSAALAGRTGAARVRTTRAEGVRIFEVVATPIALESPADPNGPALGDGKETGVVMTLRDVTDLSQAVQLRAEFVANASHELRTPLSSIRAAVETIQGGGGDDPKLLDRLTGMIAVNAVRLEEMVRDMLDLSRLESPEAPVERAKVHLRQLAESVAEEFEDVCRERKLVIEIEVEPGAETIETDPQLLHLILKNLTDNATKFAFEGTTVRLIARAVGGVGGLAESDANRSYTTNTTYPGASDRRAVRIQVIDKGVGIPLGQQHRIFERFYQVDAARSGQSKRRGTGLGLAIVRHAVKRLNGTIGVESVWQRGTTMTVELPVLREEIGERE